MLPHVSFQSYVASCSWKYFHCNALKRTSNELRPHNLWGVLYIELCTSITAFVVLYLTPNSWDICSYILHLILCLIFDTQRMSTEYLDLALENMVFFCINLRILILQCQIRLEIHICLTTTAAHWLCNLVS